PSLEPGDEVLPRVVLRPPLPRSGFVLVAKRDAAVGLEKRPHRQPGLAGAGSSRVDAVVNVPPDHQSGDRAAESNDAARPREPVDDFELRLEPARLRLQRVLAR